MKPYSEIKIKNNVRRIFSSDVQSTELTWHRDREDRIVIPVNENDWYLQMDNELPMKLNLNEEYFIPKNTYHRVIKGKTGLIVDIIKESNEEFQNKALDMMNELGGYYGLSDIDKLALLGGTDSEKLKQLSLLNIFRENGGTFGRFNIKVKVKDIDNQPINHKFSKENAGKEGYLYPYIHYDDDDLEPYVTVRFDEFIPNNKMKGGGTYVEYPIMLKNIYPIDYDYIKDEFTKHDINVKRDRDSFLDSFF